MKKVLHSIRNKPDHIKTRFVFAFAIIATAIIVAVWIITMQFIKASDDTIKTDSPFKAFGQIFKGAKTDIENTLTSSKADSITAESQENTVTNPDELVLPEPISTTEAE